MPDSSPFIASAVIALLIAVMLAFAFGTQRNIRMGNARLAWLHGALPRLGRRTTLRWLGSSAVQLDLVEPEAPFRDVSILFVLEPRDVPIIWLFSRRSGRRDVLIFRTNLRRAPRLDLEASVASSWLAAGDAEEAASWPAVALGPGVLATASAGADPAAVAEARRAWEQLARASHSVWRLSIRRTVPHLEIHLRPAPSTEVEADRVVDPIRALAITLSEG